MEFDHRFDMKNEKRSHSGRFEFDSDAEQRISTSNDQDETVQWVSVDQLAQLLRAHSSIAVLDCRSTSAFGRGRCRRAEHVSPPPSNLYYHRPKGKRDFWSVVRRRLSIGATAAVVLIDDDDGLSIRADAAQQPFSVFVMAELRKEGHKVYFLEKGAMEHFMTKYPDLCSFEQIDVDDEEASRMEGDVTPRRTDNGSPRSPSPFSLPLLKLNKLSLHQDSSSPQNSYAFSENNFSPSGRYSPSENNFDTRTTNDRDPVNIYATLYLGNADHAADRETLRRHNIEYILNVTADLDNRFEYNGSSFKYLRIPIVDNVSQDLVAYFPAANEFIDEAIRKNRGVLVHCLAGISRSVTFTVAYLMKAKSCSMNEAFDFVKLRKPNIEPNLNFMRQLLDYEKILHRSDGGRGDATPDSAVSSLSASSSSSLCVDHGGRKSVYDV